MPGETPHRRHQAPIGPMAAPELTEAMITAAMAKAEARVCTGPDRCYALPSDVDTARTRCTPHGRCRVGLIVSKGGRESHDVWLEVAMGRIPLTCRRLRFFETQTTLRLWLETRLTLQWRNCDRLGGGG